MKRSVTPELLDSNAGTPAEIAASLADLRLVNRWFGGASTMRDLIRGVVRRTGVRELSLLDVGSASGDIPVGVAAEFQGEGVRLDCVFLDRSSEHLNGTSPGVAADALSLPFRNRSFDLVSSSLLIHHLEPKEIIQFMNESLRVCRVAVLINDLRRSLVHLGLVYSGYIFYRSRLTRHDAPASVRRAYTPHELRELLLRTSTSAVEIRKHYLCRMGAIAWKQPSSEPHG